jgi:hypothetical protein
MKPQLLILIFTLAVSGCTTKSRSRLEAQNAYLAGQNAALRQQIAQFNGITVIGAVQNGQVPWVAGLTLAQAVATANYTGAQEPKAVVITHQGESAVLPANVLFSGADIPLEAGDVVELR